MLGFARNAPPSEPSDMNETRLYSLATRRRANARPRVRRGQPTLFVSMLVAILLAATTACASRDSGDAAGRKPGDAPRPASAAGPPDTAGQARARAGSTTASVQSADVSGRFGDGGIVRTDFGDDDIAAAVAVQRDRKIVVAGGSGRRFALARYTPAGRLDPSFGKGGRVLTDVGAGDGAANAAAALAIQEDGKIVVAGTGNHDFVVARYTRDGRLDPSFGGDGKVATDLAGDAYGGDYGKAIALHRDRRIVVAGRGGDDFALARYMPNGRLDRSFGARGKVLTELGDDFAVAEAVAIQDDGKIVAFGGNEITMESSFALTRYTRGGQLDRTFGDGGILLGWFGVNGLISYANGGAVQADGRIVVAGFHNEVGPNGPTPYYFTVARYTARGELDRTFGGKGYVSTAGGDFAAAIAVERDGRIVAAGTNLAKYVLIRYMPDGRLDPRFGAGGKAATDIGPTTPGSAVDDEPALALQRDGKIVIAGGTGRVGRRDFVLARFKPNGDLDS